MNEPQHQESEGADVPATPPATPLPYRAPSDDRMVRIAEFADAAEAALLASALAGQGIWAEVYGAHTGSLGFVYQGMNRVEVHVRSEDAEAAREYLGELSEDDLEPIELGPDAPAPVDDQGQPLLIVGAFENLKRLTDAQAILASGNIESVLPEMAPRGQRPAGHGKRFVLRVAGEDLARARLLLSEVEHDDIGDLCCPKCGSRRVLAVPTFWKNVAALIGFGGSGAGRSECLACHYRGDAAEFGAVKSDE